MRICARCHSIQGYRHEIMHCGCSKLLCATCVQTREDGLEKSEPCFNCKIPQSVLHWDRCLSCYRYFRKHKVERNFHPDYDILFGIVLTDREPTSAYHSH